ncbi:hypothetical protein BGZ65_001140, partial [Modicella reniformis]
MSAIDMEELEEDYGDTQDDDMAMEEDGDAVSGDGSAVLRASKAGKKLMPKVKPQMAFAPEDAELNPGLNQDRKKWLKQQQKGRQAQDLNMDEDKSTQEGSRFDLDYFNT